MSVRVMRGAPTPEEVAAVLAVLRGGRSGDAPVDRYTAWRRIRLDALRGKGTASR